MSSKSELTKTIETQQARITRLEQRFADVVSAYKNLQKEKEALESTVKIFNSKNETVENKGENENLDENDQKLKTLQQNLSVITEQKNQMEKMFQLDKKKLNTENEELKKLLEESKAEIIILKEKFEQENKELKRSNREAQRDFERKNAENAANLRELQTFLSAERNKFETLENQFDEIRSKNVTLENQIENLKKQNRILTEEMEKKSNSTREKDLIDLEELKRAKRTIDELNSKLKSIENEKIEISNLEEKRRAQIETKINDLTAENAQRVALYENRIAELSEQIGFVEKQRAQDQIMIQRFKERITQLDVENSLLTKTNSIEQNENDDLQQIDDPQIFMEKISRLKNFIRIGKERFGKDLSIEEILYESKENVNKTKYEEEIERLKNELDSYRTKSVVAFKMKNFKETTSNKESEDLRSQIDVLRDKLTQSQVLFNTENDRHNEQVEKLQHNLNSVREQHRQELEQLFNRKRLEINELECELEKQRERTVRLLEEKDREVEAMKKQIETTKFSGSIEESSSELNEVFPQSTIGGPNFSNKNESGKILFFVEEQQLREQEIVNLRRQRNEIENSLREIHRKHAFEISQYQMTIEQLQDELERIKLTERRHQTAKESENNIDYIKNVFYHYLLANDNQIKQTMANALMTILQFSSKEKAKVENEKSNRTLSTTGWFSKS